VLQVISDLLKPESVNLVVREDRRRGVHVEGLSEWVVRSPAGAQRRTVRTCTAWPADGLQGGVLLLLSVPTSRDRSSVPRNGWVGWGGFNQG